MTTDVRDAVHSREGRAWSAASRPHWLRRLVVVKLFGLLALVALLVSVRIHLATDLGREAARDGMAAFLSSRIRGTVHIGEITRLDPTTLTLSDFRITAPDGETVIRTEHMGGFFQWGALVEHGVLKLAPCYFDRAEIWLSARGPDRQVNLVHAMEVPDGRWTIPLEMNDIELVENVLHIDLPGKPPVTMRDVNGFADLHVGHLFEWRMDRNRGYADLAPIKAGFRHMSGRLRSDHAHPLVVQMLLDLEIAEPGAKLDYHVPALVGERGRAYFEHSEVDLGISDARDDCAEGDEDACARARREERNLAARREERSGARERSEDRRAALEHAED